MARVRKTVPFGASCDWWPFLDREVQAILEESLAWKIAKKRWFGSWLRYAYHTAVDFTRHPAGHAKDAMEYLAMSDLELRLWFLRLCAAVLRVQLNPPADGRIAFYSSVLDVKGLPRSKSKFDAPLVMAKGLTEVFEADSGRKCSAGAVEKRIHDVSKRNGALRAKWEKRLPGFWKPITRASVPRIS